MWRDLPLDLISKSPIARWAPVPLRLIVGYGFMEHGFAKLARGPDAFPIILQALGVPAPHLMGWLTILVEIFGGLAVLLGALVPLASIPMAAVLLVAIVTVHLPYGFSSIKLQAVTAELRGKVGDGVNQAADLISATASIPSLNFIPLTTFGNWF
jgi:putative oxidoreductase